MRVALAGSTVQVSITQREHIILHIETMHGRKRTKKQAVGLSKQVDVTCVSDIMTVTYVCDCFRFS